MSTSFSEHYGLLNSSFSQLPPTDPKKSNRISDVVKLKRMLKKWRKQANSSPVQTTTSAPTTPTHHHSSSNKTSSTTKQMGRSTSSKNIQTGGSTTKTMTRTHSNKGINFLKRTLSFQDHISTTSATTSSSLSSPPKGYLAVDVGEEKKRFTIPTSYLRHEDFVYLLQEAEEEFGFQQEGVLRIPCEVEVFEMILKGLDQAKSNNKVQSRRIMRNSNEGGYCGSTPHHRLQYHPASPIHRPASPMCR